VVCDEGDVVEQDSQHRLLHISVKRTMNSVAYAKYKSFTATHAKRIGRTGAERQTGRLTTR
jgi:hypothetical protein